MNIRLTLTVALMSWGILVLLQGGAAIVRASDYGDSTIQNERQHASIEREITSVSGKVDQLKDYADQLQNARLRERMTAVETTLDTIMRLLYTVLACVVGLIVNSLHDIVTRKRHRCAYYDAPEEADIES